jgi:hypothetical protein
MRRPLTIISLLLFAAGFAHGQSTDAPDQAEQIKALLARVAELEKQVAEIKALQVTGMTPPAKTMSPPVAQPAEEHVVEAQATANASPQSKEQEAQTAQETARQMERHYPSLQIRGFGDVDFAATDQKVTTSNSGFYLGELDLHLASALSRKISYFAEITIDPFPNQYLIEVERSFIRYDYNDHFKISFGRYHTPISYWNTAFHHGAWLQTTITRPLMVQDGGVFTPIHLVGLLAEGSIPSGGLGLNYNVGIGNGRGSFIERPGDAGDINNNRAWVAKIFARPAKPYGLELGGSVYRDKITCTASGDCSSPLSADYREWITDAYVVWTKGAPELLAEFENVNHQAVQSGRTANSDAFYVQFAYRLPWFEKTVKPYYRFEYTHMPLSEQVFTYQPQVESIVGVRYDISSFAAFKVEYHNLASQAAQGGHPAQPALNGVFVQTAFTF